MEDHQEPFQEEAVAGRQSLALVEEEERPRLALGVAVGRRIKALVVEMTRHPLEVQD